MIRIANRIFISESELSFTYLPSQGPGGQNVNKVATAARLVFAANASPALPAEVKNRLRGIAGRRMTAGGIVIINAQRFRSQERNRDDAIDRLVGLLVRATVRPNIRRLMGPTRSMLAQGIQKKRRRSATKRSRKQPATDD